MCLPLCRQGERNVASLGKTQVLPGMFSPVSARKQMPQTSGESEKNVIILLGLWWISTAVGR